MNALRRALLAIVVVSSGLTGSAGADTIKVGGFNVKALLDLATYEVHTVLRSADGTLVDKTTPALVGVPTPVNVDNASLSAPDLTVTVLTVPLPPSIQLRIDRLTLGRLPVLVEAVFDVPGEPDGGAAFGYDGRDDTAPGSFSTTVTTFAKTPSTSEIGLSLDTLRPGSELGVIAELFTPAPKGQRLDPTAARLDLDPVPNFLRANVLSDRAASRTLVELKSSAPTVAAVAVSDRATARERRFDATIDRLPASVAVDATTNATTRHDEITYQASAPIASLTVTAKDITGDTEVELSGTLTGIPAMFAITVDRPSSGPQQATWTADGRLGQLTLNGKASRAGAIERAATFTVTDLATKLTVTRDANRTSMVADSPIGAIEAGLASGGPVQLLPDPTYAYAVVKGSAFSVAARVSGLQSLSFEDGDPFVVEITMTPGPLHARAVKDGTTLDAQLKNLPARARVSVSPSAGTADYNATSPIEEITVDVTSDTPIVERLKEAHLLIQGVPANLHLEFGARDPAPSGVSARSTCVPTFDQPDCPDDIPGDGGDGDGGDDGDIPPPGDFPDIDSKRSFVLDAHGATLGLAQVFLTSGPQPTRPLTDTEDGVVVEDLADRLVVFGRITGLQKAVARLKVVDERNIANFLATTAHFELHRDVTAIAGRSVRAELNALQRAGSGKVDRFTATLTPERLADGTLGSLPGVTTVDLVTSFDVRPPNPTKQFLSYTADAKIGRIEAEATVADLPNPIFVGVSDVPTSFSVCRASDGRCGTEVDKPFRDGGTLHYTASSAATVDVFMCFKPEQNCNNANREAFQEGLVITSLKVPKTITFEFHKGQGSGPDPTVVLVDTGNQAITGEVKLVSGVLRATARLGLPDPVGGFIGPDLQVALFGGVVRLDGVFPGGLRVDRLVLTVVDGNLKHTGGVFCPAGSLLDFVVTLPGVDINKDLKPLVCKAV